MAIDDTWVPPQTYELTTPDGRVLRYCLYGPENGTPMLWHNGTPSSHVLSQRKQERFTQGGIRALVYDRPGYGGSTRQLGRTVVDAVDDARRLADAVGWDRFATAGGSGGGPHTLACAARMPDRVTRCLAVVSLAPSDADGLDWYAGMSPGNVDEFTLAQQGEHVFRPTIERIGREAYARLESGEPPIPPYYELSQSDLELFRKRLAEDDPGRLVAGKGTWIDGLDGWVDDTMAFLRPWGFDVSEIGVPVSVWYGPDDVLVPRGHADWLIANVPGAQPYELSGGHGPSDDDHAAINEWLGR